MSLTIGRYRGYLATHEIYVVLLDTLPLLIGISVYCYFWPGRYLTPETKVNNFDFVASGPEEHTNGLSVERETGAVGLATLGKDNGQPVAYDGDMKAGVASAGEADSVKSTQRL